MYIAQLKFKTDKWRKVGALWYDPDRHYAQVFLTGFVFGVVQGFPFERIENPPFLRGDLMGFCNSYEKSGELKKEWQYCGFMYSDSSTEGKAVYHCVLSVIPVGIKRVEGHGIPLRVFLDDKEMGK